MPVSTRSFRSFALLTTAAILAAAPLRAQGPSADSPRSAVMTATDSAASAGPTLRSAAVGVRHVDESAASPAAPARASGRHSNSEALMIVGGVAFLAGIAVGGGAGYAISIGGAVIGLYGLYQYLQ